MKHIERPSIDVLRELKAKVFDQGRSIVPLLGAGISSEAGVPRLAEVTEYLAKTKAYIRHKVYARIRSDVTIPWDRDDWRAILELPAFSTPPRDYLRQFGWPDPQELDSDLLHWIERRRKIGAPPYPSSLRQIVVGEILDSLGSIDQNLVQDLLGCPEAGESETIEPDAILSSLDGLRGIGGRFWKILLTEMTRSSEDLIDTLFQRLTLKRYPATSHRFLALLTPILRLRLILTTNFDRLLEEALRAEGHEPTVFEVADGLTLPHPKLMQSGLSIIKLHGGAYGLLVGDRLDSPLDEETRRRFRAYLPERPILLVLGLGGEDQRVLDMLELVEECQGEVYWFYFQHYTPNLLIDRFSRGHGELADFITMASYQDPGAFLRQFYSELTRSHPSSSLPFKFSHLPPVLPGPDRAQEAPKKTKKEQTPSESIVVYTERPGLGRIESAKELAHFVASKRTTHQPLWVDIETKFTLESLVTDIIQQLRRFDPGLPPELVTLEQLAARGRRGVAAEDSRRGIEKVVRRLYASMARGRYLLALNGVASFGSQPTRHHSSELPGEDGAGGRLSPEQEYFLVFVQTLIDWQAARPRKGSVTIESLGIQDSILALTLDQPATAEGRVLHQELENLLEGSLQVGFYPPRRVETDAAEDPEGFARRAASDPLADPALILITACRRRRNACALANLLPKYLELAAIGATSPGDGDPPEPSKPFDEAEVQEKLRSLAEQGLITFLEGGDAWMGRKLRNLVYESVRNQALQPTSPHPICAAAILTFAHLDLATYFYREIYTGSQDAQALTEALYHRWAYLKYLLQLQRLCPARVTTSRKRRWLDKLQRHPNDAALGIQPGEDSGGAFWMGSHPIVVDGQLDQQAIAHRRVRGLRALINVLEQEREPLLRRISAAALKAWIHSIRSEVAEIAGVEGLQDALAIEVSGLREYLLSFLDDLEVDLRTDRLDSVAILRCRHAGVRRLLAIDDPSAPEAPDDQWLWNPEVSPGPKRLEEFFRTSESSSPSDRFRSDREKSKLFRAVLDVLWARTRNPWLTPPDPNRLRDLHEIPQRLLAAWHQSHHGALPSNIMLEARARLQVLEADIALWGISPWDAKGTGLRVLAKTRHRARQALAACEGGLRILDDTREDDRATRSYFHSLNGRARYLLDQFDPAYRQLDRARSVLQEHSMTDREPRAIALLRQAESLMLHADHELTHWAIQRLATLRCGSGVDSETSDETPEPTAVHTQLPWRLFLSREGRRKLDLGIPQSLEELEEASPARQLLALSLANQAPEALQVLENLSHVNYFPDHEIPLGTLRSRLDSAKGVLDRAERSLEGGRRDVQWWGCLFQLRAQLAIEQLLLLLTGDFSPLGIEAPALPRERPSKIDQEVTRWLIGQSHKLASEDQTPVILTVPKNLADRRRFGIATPLTLEVPRKRFINRFRALVRQGLVAVRQGLDILLPGPANRTIERLQSDVLIRRLLRLWVELLVCGASAHIASERSNPEQSLDFEAQAQHERDTRLDQWEEWLFLNQVSGLVHLPSPPALEKHFEALYAFGAESPGLAARAQTLAKIDYFLSKRGKKNSAAGADGPPLSVLEILVRELAGEPRAPGGPTS